MAQTEVVVALVAVVVFKMEWFFMVVLEHQGKVMLEAIPMLVQPQTFPVVVEAVLEQ
jgi:hypothetical protein